MSGASKKYGKSIALGASLLVHVVLFGVFAAIEFTQPQSEAVGAGISQSQISRIVQKPSITAVPKVKSISSGRSSLQSLDELDVNITGILESHVPEPAGNTEFEIQPVVLPDVQAGYSETVEFFGCSTSGRKVVFVVDTSGSMLGFLGQVKEQLKNSIANLEPDNFFYVIFFGNDSISELGDGKLLRATPSSKNKAYAFIDSVQAGGKTNALDAIERAMRIKDGSGNAAQQIFFLTDGLDVEGEYRQKFSVHLKNLRKTLAPNARINTIGFWMEDEDKQLLGQMASETGGSFTYVE